MARTEDLTINRGVRRIMIRHWVDLGRLSVRTTRGKVMIYGVLQRIPGGPIDFPPAVVDAIFYEIGRLSGVVGVSPHIDNWTNEGGKWRPVNETEQRKTSLDA